ncbi:metal-binding protein ZinT [Jeotgalibacillus proteolyticus]|uniref:metal-binding protein ZinT n=1 Tax=Jeotgalibacillus proteolyticus TaxID=2082395 RepID=UPI003CEEF428
MSKKWMIMFVFLTAFTLAACGEENTATNEEENGSASEEVEEQEANHEEEHDHDHEEEHDHDHDEEHEHGHDHDHEVDEEAQKIYDGYFEDDQIQDRELSDWEGDWQSVYPYLEDGTLDEVFAHKAEEGDMTAEEYKKYYKVGYETEVDRIVIEGDTFTFFENGEESSGSYTYDGYEVLEYEKGNRGVRYIFKLDEEQEGSMPAYIQFSDHGIEPTDADHYHLYWGDDREALLDEVTNWPTYYFSDLSGEEIAEEMMGH